MMYTVRRKAMKKAKTNEKKQITKQIKNKKRKKSVTI